MQNVSVFMFTFYFYENMAENKSENTVRQNKVLCICRDMANSLYFCVQPNDIVVLLDIL